MADTLYKTIHDTVYIKGADALDILNKTNEFYNSAWDKLVLIVTIAISIVGVLVPFLIQWWQKERFSTLRGDTIAEAKSLIQEEVSKLDSRFDSMYNKSMGYIHYTQASILFNEKNYIDAYGVFVSAITYFLDFDDMIDGIKIILDRITDCATKLTKDEINEAHQRIDYGYNDLINGLDNINKLNLLTDGLESYKRVLDDKKLQLKNH